MEQAYFGNHFSRSAYRSSFPETVIDAKVRATRNELSPLYRQQSCHSDYFRGFLHSMIRAPKNFSTFRRGAPTPWLFFFGEKLAVHFQNMELPMKNQSFDLRTIYPLISPLSICLWHHVDDEGKEMKVDPRYFGERVRALDTDEIKRLRIRMKLTQQNVADKAKSAFLVCERLNKERHSRNSTRFPSLDFSKRVLSVFLLRLEKFNLDATIDLKKCVLTQDRRD